MLKDHYTDFNGFLNEDSLNESGFYSRAFSRNIGLLTEVEQKSLKQIHIGIPGLGGVGGLHSATLARTGIGKLSIADFDIFEVENSNRQYGAFTDSIKKPKTGTMKEELLRINPFLDIRVFEKGVTDDVIDQFLDGPDIIIDCLDFFVIDMRCKLYDRALAKGIHVISAGPIGFGCSMVTFSPFSNMSFTEYFDFRKEDSQEVKQVKFTLGMNPDLEFYKTFTKFPLDIRNRSVPSLGLACNMCASMAVCEVLKIVTGRGKLKAAPYWRRYDPFLNKFYECYRMMGNRHPVRKLKILFYPKPELNAPSAPAQEKVQLPDSPKKSEQLNQEQVRFLIHNGTRAISADNSQHWYFSYSDKSIMIHEDPERSNFNSSRGKLPQLISYGAVAENIAIAASAIGLKTEVIFKNISENPQPVAECLFSEGEKADPLFDFIEHRHTNRYQYFKTPVSAPCKQKLLSSISTFDNVNMYCYDQIPEKKTITRIVSSSDEMIWLTRSLYEDLFRWIRHDNSSLDGLPFNALGLKFHEMASLKLMQNPLALKLFTTFGMHKVATLKSHFLMSKSPLHVIFTVNKNDPFSFFNAGRAIERFWITANSINLSVQPFTSPIIILHEELFGGKGKFNPERQNKIDLIVDLWNKCSDLENEVPVMLFRVGYGPLVEHRTARRDITDMIIDASASSYNS